MQCRSGSGDSWDVDEEHTRRKIDVSPPRKTDSTTSPANVFADTTDIGVGDAGASLGSVGPPRAFQRLLAALNCVHARELAQVRLQVERELRAERRSSKEVTVVSDRWACKEMAASAPSPRPSASESNESPDRRSHTPPPIGAPRRRTLPLRTEGKSLVSRLALSDSVSPAPSGWSTASGFRRIMSPTETGQFYATWTEVNSEASGVCGRRAPALDQADDPSRILSAAERAVTNTESLAAMEGWKLKGSTMNFAGEATWNTLIRRIVRHQAFDAICGIFIMLNAALIGWSADTAIWNATRGYRPDRVPTWLSVADVAFAMWFTMELVLRMAVDGLVRFVCSHEDWAWNLFDIIVVGTNLAETFLESSGNRDTRNDALMNNLAVMRFLRILRLTRAIRVVRLIRCFKALRMMVYSVLLSGFSLFWALLMLSLTIFVFGTYFAQIVAYHFSSLEEIPSADDPLVDMFGSLAASGYTLYMAISGGVSWGEIGKPLIEIHRIHSVVLAFFTFFTIFALVNIITGIFVDTAIRSAHNDKEEVIQEQLHSVRASFAELRKLFSAMDNNGTITLAELETQFHDERVRAHLSAIGIEVDKARALFRLLDLDGNGEVTVEEFVCGCMRLKGAATSVDLATLMYENKRMAEQIRRFFRKSECSQARVEEWMAQIAGEVVPLP